MAYVLSTYGMLNFDEADRAEEIANRSSKAGLNSMRLNCIRAGEYDHMTDDDDFNLDNIED